MTSDERTRVDGPLWATGAMTVRVCGTSQEPERVVNVARPLAVVGRDAGCDVRVADRNVSARHVYLHADSRGVFAVDLATRLGIRIQGKTRLAGWIRVGQSLEVGGRRLELLRLEINGQPVRQEGGCTDPLRCDPGARHLAKVTLTPRLAPGSAWELSSELAFLGRSAECAIPIQDGSAARVHCAVLRTPSGAFLVDLCGRRTQVGGRAVRGASILADGDALLVGSTWFDARVSPAPTSAVQALGSRERRLASSDPALFGPTNLRADAGEVARSPSELLQSLLGRSLPPWMLEILREGVTTASDVPSEPNSELAARLAAFQQQNAPLLRLHLTTMEQHERELLALRAELSRRTAGAAPAQLDPDAAGVAPSPAQRPAIDPPAESYRSTPWLQERIGQLEAQSRKAWKDLFLRLSASREQPL